MTVLGRIAGGLAYAAIVSLALAALGALFAQIPVLGSLGPLLVSPFGTWIILIGLGAAILLSLRWRRTRRHGALIMAGVAAFAALGAGIVGVQQFATARANRIPVDLLKILWSGEVPRSAPPLIASYGSAEGHALQLAVFRPAAAASPGSGGAPILIYVHGGGWGAGDVHDREVDSRWFADRGYLVVSVDYTLSTADRHAWNIAEPQVGCALIWVAANAARFGGDPARLALFGESAGGNLVVNVAYKAAAGRLQPSCPGALPHIAAVVAPYPVLDAVRMYHNTDVIAGKFAPVMTTHYTGGTPEQYPDRYAAISSPNHITGAAPPTLLLPGLADHLLPPDAAFDFAAKARAAGVDIRVIAVPHAEHSFDQRPGSIGSQIVRSSTLQFLALHGMPPS